MQSSIIGSHFSTPCWLPQLAGRMKSSVFLFIEERAQGFSKGRDIYTANRKDSLQENSNVPRPLECADIDGFFF